MLAILAQKLCLDCNTIGVSTNARTGRLNTTNSTSSIWTSPLPPPSPTHSKPIIYANKITDSNKHYDKTNSAGDKCYLFYNPSLPKWSTVKDKPPSARPCSSSRDTNYNPNRTDYDHYFYICFVIFYILLYFIDLPLPIFTIVICLPFLYFYCFLISVIDLWFNDSNRMGWF